MTRFIFICCWIFPAMLSAQGIRFEHGSWADALSKAQQEHKLIFMDAYTSWCGPCKAMAAKVFPDSAVGAYFNAHFVNVKMDMEKGEGIGLAERYKVALYPTLLFINADGLVAHRIVGYHEPADLLAAAKKADDPSANLAALEKRYKGGERGTKVLFALLEARAAAYDPGTSQLANEYLITQTDLGSPDNMEIIFRYVDDPFSAGFDFLSKNRSRFDSSYTAEEVAGRIDLIFESYVQNHPDLQLGEVQRLYGTVYPEQGERLASAYRLTYYMQRNDMHNFGLAAMDHYQRFPSDDSDELNEIAWLFCANIDDAAMHKQALSWAKQSVALHESYYNQFTLASLYAKTGSKKKAKKAAQRSIELAKQSGDDYSQTEQLLKTLK